MLGLLVILFPPALGIHSRNFVLLIFAFCACYFLCLIVLDKMTYKHQLAVKLSRIRILINSHSDTFLGAYIYLGVLFIKKLGWHMCVC